MTNPQKHIRPRIIIAFLVLLPILYVASSAPMLRWTDGPMDRGNAWWCSAGSHGSKVVG
jgi:hypothetical protein